MQLHPRGDSPCSSPPRAGARHVRIYIYHRNKASGVTRFHGSRSRPHLWRATLGLGGTKGLLRALRTCTYRSRAGICVRRGKEAFLSLCVVRRGGGGRRILRRKFFGAVYGGVFVSARVLGCIASLLHRERERCGGCFVCV